MQQLLFTPTAVALGTALLVAVSACDSDRAMAPAAPGAGCVWEATPGSCSL